MREKQRKCWVNEDAVNDVGQQPAIRTVRGGKKALSLESFGATSGMHMVVGFRMDRPWVKAGGAEDAGR